MFGSYSPEFLHVALKLIPSGNVAPLMLYLLLNALLCNKNLRVRVNTRIVRVRLKQGPEL